MKSGLSKLAVLAGLVVAACIAACTAACTSVPKPRIVSTGSGSVFIDDGGRGGVPVVFIHGNGGRSSQWRAQLTHLRKTRRAAAIDLPGFGKSSAPAQGDFSLSTMASAIDASTRAAGIDRFVIVGHSYAGAVVAKYAAEHPERVAGVIYVDAAAKTLPLNQQQKDQLAAGLRADKMKVVHAWFAPILKPSSQSVQSEVFESVEQTDTESFIGALLSLADFDAKTLVGAYHGPVTAIAASDLETPASFQKQFPDIAVVRIANAGHWLMLDKPDEVNAALDAFLATIH